MGGQESKRASYDVRFPVDNASVFGPTPSSRFPCVAVTQNRPNIHIVPVAPPSQSDHDMGFCFPSGCSGCGYTLRTCLYGGVPALAHPERNRMSYWDGAISFYSSETWEKLGQISNAHSRDIRCVERIDFLSQGGRLLSGGDDRFIRLWNISRGGEKLGEFSGSTSSVYSLSPVPSKKWFLSVARDHRGRIWDIVRSKQVSEVRFSYWAFRVRFGGPHYPYLFASMTKGTLHMADLGGSIIQSFNAEPDKHTLATALCQHPSCPHLFFVGHRSGQLVLWDVRKGGNVPVAMKKITVERGVSSGVADMTPIGESLFALSIGNPSATVVVNENLHSRIVSRECGMTEGGLCCVVPFGEIARTLVDIEERIQFVLRCVVSEKMLLHGLVKFHCSSSNVFGFRSLFVSV